MDSFGEGTESAVTGLYDLKADNYAVELPASRDNQDRQYRAKRSFHVRDSERNITSLGRHGLTSRQFEQPGLPQGFEPRTPAPLSGYQPVKRTYDGSFMSGREIRPKPASGSGLSPALPIDQPPRKKRGRPTKAEAQAKAEASTASAGPTPRSEGIAPSSAGPAVRPIAEIESPITVSPISAAPPDLPKPILPPAARIPISSMMTQTTPTSAPEAGQSSSSSGKRKRGRSTRSDHENNPFTEEGSARQLQGLESPYGGAPFEPSDTPARTAILRHRDETEAGAQRYDSQAQSPQARPEP